MFYGKHNCSRPVRSYAVKTILLGPLLSLLPRRWRESNSLYPSIDWRVAAALSGLMESLIAIVALVYWYSYSVTHWAADAVDSAIRAGAEIDPNAVGFAGVAGELLFRP
jgi:hypothetical protein